MLLHMYMYLCSNIVTKLLLSIFYLFLLFFFTRTFM